MHHAALKVGCTLLPGDEVATLLLLSGPPEPLVLLFYLIEMQQIKCLHVLAFPSCHKCGH